MLLSCHTDTPTIVSFSPPPPLTFECSPSCGRNPFAPGAKAATLSVGRTRVSPGQKRPKGQSIERETNKDKEEQRGYEGTYATIWRYSGVLYDVRLLKL